jgi:hypothetical protein
MAIADVDEAIVENPSLFNFKDGNVDTNKPSTDDFKFYSKNYAISVDYFSLLKEIRTIFSSVDTAG